MAKKNSELEEAYDVLDKLSADEKKRLEYETRQRAIRDYNIGMLTAERRGIEAGRKIGITEGENRINQLNIELSKLGRTADILKAAVDKEYQEKLLKEFELLSNLWDIRDISEAWNFLKKMKYMVFIEFVLETWNLLQLSLPLFLFIFFQILIYTPNSYFPRNRT